VPVITHERLAGNPHSGGHDSVQTCQRLLKVFPDAGVLIVIREQCAMIRSIYNHYVREGGACTLRQYLDPPMGAKIPLFDLRFLEYHRLIEAYRHHFEGRVLVLPYEEFTRCPITFCNAIGAFAGAPEVSVATNERVNVSLNGTVLFAMRMTNRFFGLDNVNPCAWRCSPTLRRLYHRLDRALPKRLGMWYERRNARIISQRVGSCFAESNRRTSEMIGMDLSEYGYLT
jgi:hypothetical protein